MADYKEIARQARIKVLELVWKAQTSHIGSLMSCIDILAVLFEKVNVQNDEVILSKGWAAAAWYYFLWRKGVITTSELESFCQPGSKFIGLIEPMGRWGLRCAGGSMGMGLPFAVGFALAKKLKGEDGKVYCLMSDGECQTGTFYESILIARQHNLDNLIIIVDANGFQAMGRISEIINIEPLAQRTEMLGFQTSEIDGHDFKKLEDFIGDYQSYPRCIIARTVKGKGVSFMEGDNKWHYLHLSEEDYERACAELEN